jgi:elongation factor P--(R)-beta-lysine ligase
VIPYQGRRITLAPPWPKITVAAAFDQYGSMDMNAALAADRFEEVLAFGIEPHLGIDRPDLSPRLPGGLQHPGGPDPRPVRPFPAIRTLYGRRGNLQRVYGTDGRGGTAETIHAGTRDAEKTGQAVYPLPEQFLNDLASMPPAAGNALGIDRLVMIFCDTACIDDVTAFTPEEL